jgi:hypothetical protein
MAEQNGKVANLYHAIVDWFKEAADWVQENLGDPAIAGMIRDDLGLAPGQDIPPEQSAKFKTFAAGLDPDKAAFNETVDEVKEVVDALVQLGETLKGGGMSGWDVAYLVGRVAASDSVRLRFPAAYAAAKLLLLVSDDPDSAEQLDPALLLGLMQGQTPPNFGERVAQQLSAGIALAITLLQGILDRTVGPGLLQAYYGWDASPDSPTPKADLVSARAASLLIGAPGHPIGQLSATLLAVPPAHGGPGLFASFGGQLNAEQTVGETVYAFQAGMSGAFDVFLPFKGAPGKLQAGGDPNGFVRLGVTRRNPQADEPALRIGEPGKTRVDIGKLGWNIEVGGKRAAFGVRFNDAALVVDLGEGDGFLQSAAGGGEVKVSFDFGIVADTENGIHLDGGSNVHTVIPISKTLLGTLTAHYVELGLGPGRDGRALGVELSGAFALRLGPFAASVDRLGLLLDFDFRQGNLGFVDLTVGFKPPNGIGLVLDAKAVKGGGYLFIDPVRHEYAGALELAIGPVSAKAIALLTTRLPDGSSGWSLLLLVYAQFPPIQLSFGFTLTGLGGMIGLQHAPNTDALIAGMSSGVLDDILFPKDPVADAPRIINRLRVVFPQTANALVIGPMLELGWGTPSVLTMRIGVLIQIDNALGGDRPISFSRVVLLGQVLIQVLPAVDAKLAVLRLLTDFIGVLEFDPFRLGFVARLRDSRVGPLSLTGALVIRAVFGDKPSFILAAGGFHPRFQDKPAGLPSPIDRIGFKEKIGVIEISLAGYFAITPATVQAGAEFQATADLGPVDIKGSLGFDAICYFEPHFHFEVDVHGNVRIRFKGHTLASVGLEMTLSGPGRWRARGKGSFSILFWDVDFDFDEKWGEDPAVPALAGTNVAQLLQAELSLSGNWSAQLPVGGEALVTIGTIAGDEGVLAHPLGQLVFEQQRVPFGLELARFGNTGVSGQRLFNVEEVKVGARAVAPEVRIHYFARSQFVDLSEADKLTKPSFDPFPCGVAVGTRDYRAAPSAVESDLDFETYYLDPTQRFHIRVRDTVVSNKLGIGLAGEQALRGAAARSKLRANSALAPAIKKEIRVNPPSLAVAGKDTMVSVPEAQLEGAAAASFTLAEQGLRKLAPGARAKAQIVEQFELTD